MGDTNSSATVPMYAPDGTLGDIPYERMHEALNAGGKMAVNMTAPDGTPGVVPADKVQEAVKAGGKVVPYNISGSSASSSPPGQTSMHAQPKPFTVEWFKSKLINNIEDPLTKALPGAGATIGAIAGAGGGTFAGPGPGNVAGAIGGAAIGGMGGEAASQLLRRGFGFESPATSDEASRKIMTEGALQGVIQGVSEGTGALAGPLQRAAVNQYERALAPTTRPLKDIAKKITPELIDRGEYGSIQGLQQTAQQNAKAIKPQLDAAYSATPANATLNSGTKIVQDLENLKGKYIVNGMSANPKATDAISGVQDIVKQYGPDINPNSLRKIKSIFDDPVASQGGFAGADLATKYTLKAQKAAGNSIRDIMGQANPDVAALNKEISFWLDVQKVTKATAQRQTGQAGGLMKVLGPLAAGGAASSTGLHFGATAGIEAGAAVALTTVAVQAMRSPLWRTASAVLKDRFADALARGSVGDATALLARFGAAAAQAPTPSRDSTGSLASLLQPNQGNQ